MSIPLPRKMHNSLAFEESVAAYQAFFKVPRTRFSLVLLIVNPASTRCGQTLRFGRHMNLASGVATVGPPGPGVETLGAFGVVGEECCGR